MAIEFPFKSVDASWQQYWDSHQTFKTDESSGRPPYYILDMFPYPSGSGLHVGHPLGYIATDILARYRRHLGYEVLHPMGYDAFGLPAEQYAIETGNHPGIFTDENIKGYETQLRKIGLSFDWSRQVKTSDPEYYKWTQWIFLQIFNSYYDTKEDKAKPIGNLIEYLNIHGTKDIPAAGDLKTELTPQEWQNLSDAQKNEVLMHFRLAYIGESQVNWCEALGTVLSNEEVINGVSERGGHPVIRKTMKQWFMRITAYADRLLAGLDRIDWPEPLKEMQRNWIGKSQGALIRFAVDNQTQKVEVFTTRPDTVFGCTFMVLSPEHSIVNAITTDEYKEAVENYQKETAKKSERERTAETKEISGQFTGAFALHPFTKEKLPIFISQYVLAEYGTGAVMAVPGHDSRDFAFAKRFELPIRYVVEGGKEADTSYDARSGKMINSDFLNGLEVNIAIAKAIEEIAKKQLGEATTNYRLRDANFSRQRYWGEPFPIVYKNGIATAVETLPVELPVVESYAPAGDGRSPLASAAAWVNSQEGTRDTNTMPGWAGSSWYYLRYMDPTNSHLPFSAERVNYWKNVDFYVGGSEHATGHLLYSRFWHKVLYDYNLVPTEEPFAKLVNQGMIQGRSSLVYRIEGTNTFVSAGLKSQYEVTPLHVDVNIVHNDILDIKAFRQWRGEYADAEFILEGDRYICGAEVEKMSKRWYNVVRPDDVIAKYGADVFRMYEMFLGPLEASKPWNTEGIDGVFRFINKLWRQIIGNEGELLLTDESPSPDALKALHKCIKKVNDDIERLSLNTCISSFMICVNELTAMKCTSRSIYESFAVLLSPFAPHFSEEIWHKLGHPESIERQPYPKAEDKHLKEDAFDYPISFNGKTRFKISIASEASATEVEALVRSHPDTMKWLEGKSVKKIIVVPNRIVNVVA